MYCNKENFIFIHPLLHPLKLLTVVNTLLLLRHRAEGVKTTAETVKQALVDAKTAQTSAEKAIARAEADIGETEARLAQVTNQKKKEAKIVIN